MSLTIAFRQGKANLDTAFSGNADALLRLTDEFRAAAPEKAVVRVSGFASPEGSLNFNRILANARALAVVSFLRDSLLIPEANISSRALGVDWADLRSAVAADPRVPRRIDVLRIIDEVPEVVADPSGTWITSRRQQLMDLGAGQTWNYLLANIFPSLRGAQIDLLCPLPPHDVPPVEPQPLPVADVLPAVVIDSVPLAPDSVSSPSRPVFWSLHTNMLFDVLAVPNLGAEVCLGRGFSIAANWWYAWWKTDRRHRYWRTYGGFIAPRFWFGSAARRKPLTGHHVGVYAQALLYDFEWGGTGYLSGTPGRNIFHHPTWGAGIEYGFALPVGRRLNIDFSIGLGYLQGRYWKYEPQDGHYVWLSTYNRKWWGPTKAEISLVWLIGRDNFNPAKGGRL